MFNACRTCCRYAREATNIRRREHDAEKVCMMFEGSGMEEICRRGSQSRSARPYESANSGSYSWQLWTQGPPFPVTSPLLFDPRLPHPIRSTTSSATSCSTTSSWRLASPATLTSPSGSGSCSTGCSLAPGRKTLGKRLSQA